MFALLLLSFSSPMSNLTATEASNTFWLDFKKEKQVIEQTIDRSLQIPKDQLPDHFNTILQQINQLEKRITEATTFIPSYDERQYAMQIRELTGLLDATRTQLTPKPKFSFKTKLGKPKTKTPQASIPAPVKPLDQTSLLENTINFSNLENQIITLSGHKELAAVDISLSYLSKCIIWLPTETITISTVHIKQIKDCVIVCGTVQGSILIYGLEHSILTVNCHQFRMHDAKNVDVLMCVSSRPIMEDSNGIRVGNTQDQKSSVNNYFSQMDDFNWLKQQASPNWTLMDNNRIEHLNHSLRALIGLEQLDLISHL
ncbi:tubulin binding cofactor C-domain-containing protein [Chlamydoabsidia padenii]|nr:tubulin binding cofactor C-domain-containing protein [Chlamydoabsidia padenii]